MPAGGLFFYSFGEVRRPANEAVASALMTPATEKDPRGFSLARRSPSECESNAPARLYDEAYDSLQSLGCKKGQRALYG